MMSRNLSEGFLSRVRNIRVRAVRSGNALHTTDVCRRRLYCIVASSLRKRYPREREKSESYTGMRILLSSK